LEDNSVPNTMSLGWNDLVHLKRKLSTSLRQITENIIDIDTNKLPKANHQIHEEKTFLNSLLIKSRQIQSGIQFENEELLRLSGKVSQSKNFLSVMQNRLPDEREDSLLQRAKVNESLIHAGKYDNTREKDQILSVIRDASMKLEAIKAFRIIKDQLLQLEIQSERTKKSLLMLDDESKSLQQEIHRCKKKIQTSYDSKHRIIEERSRCLSEYNEISLQLKKLNTQMDTAADQKRRRKAQIPPDYDESIYKVKESARKKMQDGAKLTLEELRLIYDENSF
jgi:uncharacterized coiled-coil DUF342 family protein